MAEGTRATDLQKLQLLMADGRGQKKFLQTQIENLSNSHLGIQESIGELHNSQAHTESIIESMQLQLHEIDMQLQNLNIRRSESGDGIGGNSNLFGGNGFQNGSLNFQGLELPFPKFDGSKPRSWIHKCNSYFRIINTIAEENKVMFAALHMEGEADLWVEGYLEQHTGHSWNEFVSALLLRFEDVDQDFIIGKFHNLKQQGTVNELLENFEDLKSYLMLYFRDLPSEYYTSSFINMLRDDIKGAVLMMKPKSFEESVSFARKQEFINDAMIKRITENNKDYIPPIKLITVAEMIARGEKNLCYNCDEVFTPGHRCKQRQAFMVMTIEEEEAYPEEMTISVIAMSGNSSLSTFRVRANAYGKEIHLLISSGSTHCFVDENLCREIGCRVDYTTPTMVSVANGSKIISRAICPDFMWEVQGYRFQYPMRIIKLELGGCDMVLGSNWLRKHSPVGFDFGNMKVTVNLKGKRVTLKALTETAEMKMVSASDIQ